MLHAKSNMGTIFLRGLLLVGFLCLFNNSYFIEAHEDSKTLIREKIVELFAEDAEAFTRIVYFIDKEEQNYGSGDVSPIWKTLNATVKFDHLFKQYLERLVEDTKTAEEDPNYLALMYRIWNEMMEPSDKAEDASSQQGLQISKDGISSKIKIQALGGFSQSWGMIPVESQTQIFHMIGKVADRATMVTVKQMASSVNKVGGKVLVVTLASIHMSYEAWVNLNRWWKGEISGARCAKNLVDSFASIAASVYGGLAGASYGSAFGPVGTIVGGVGGSIFGGQVGMTFSDWLTQKIFNLPKSEALENAYNFFGVEMTASADVINSKYREYSLRHHPDKGGMPEDFHKVQIHMGIIKVARGQTIN